MSSPDPNIEFLLRARSAVEEAVEAARSETKRRVSLFLEAHYPFFDNDVQTILMERHPSTNVRVKASPWYPIDAYLWGEQHVWVAYSDEFGMHTLPLEEQSSFYMAMDIRWFCRLMVAIASVVEGILEVGDPRIAVSHEARLQAWTNRFSGTEKRPNSWLEGTQFLKRTKEHEKTSCKDPRKSIRVTASTINKNRRCIFELWLPCWEAELRNLGVRLASYQDRAER